MVRLSPQSEERDFLQVLAAERKELVLEIETARPLRKPRNSKQARAIERVRAEALSQISAQLGAGKRRAFRGRISLELHLSLPSGRHEAGLGPIVKDYLDLLVGPVVADDARIDHLLVLRDPSASPTARVQIRCLPVSIFSVDYDRAFRVLGQVGFEAAALRSPHREPLTPGQRAANGLERPERTWGLRHFDEHARGNLHYEEGVLELIRDLDAQEEAQLEEDPDGFVDLDIPSSTPEFEDAGVRERTRDYLEEVTGFARGDWLTDQGFDARDRPGPDPDWIEEAVAHDAADVVTLDDRTPGCLVLPAPPERKRSPDTASWQREIERELATRRLSGRWYRARFRGALALDIALRGGAAPGTDLDNAASKMLTAFSRAFASADPTVAGYRIYRRAAQTKDVRVRMMPAVRLEALTGAMADARQTLRLKRVERTREYDPVR
jgi:hypothetical protein